MGLVDYDQPQPLVRHEQGRARADHHLRLARNDCPPGASPLGLLDRAVPQHRRHPEAGLEPAQEVFGQRNFGQHDQHLLSARDGGRDCFEIAFGLARSGHPIKQEGREFVGFNRFDKGVGSGLLVRVEGRQGKIGAGARIWPVEIDSDRLKQSSIHHPAQHPVRYTGKFGQFADRRLLALQRVHRYRPLRGQALRFAAREAIFSSRPAAAQCRGAAQRHPRNR